MQKNNERIATRLDVTVCISLACLFIVLFGVLVEKTKMMPLYAVLLCTFAYLFLVFLWACLRLSTDSLLSHRVLHNEVGEALEDVVARVAQPAFICDRTGKITWCNRMLVDLVGRRDLVIGASIDDVCSLSEEDVKPSDETKKDGEREDADDGEQEVPHLATIGDRLFTYEGIRVGEGERERYFVLFTDCTELEQLTQHHAAEKSVVAYIVIDNIDELQQYVQDTYSTAALRVEDIIREWVRGMSGIIKAYEKDKFVAFFNNEQLERCISRRFDVLDTVRSVRVGDGMPITVSIGISSVEGTLAERETSAQAALDMALQRGGDQAVHRSDDGDKFYGGKTKAVQKRANVRSRVVANELSSLMARTESVLIMGHRFGDFDSFGATVGIARLAMFCGVRPHIVVNRRDPNLAPCFEKLAGVDTYDSIFVDTTEGMDLIRPDTLLIVVDVNNFAHTESPELVRAARTVAIIDHHRKTAEFDRDIAVNYIEPAASSASELVSEILEQHMTSKSLLKEEAELLLAGILLDTKQFTRNTGTRTFGAALYLRGEGAIPSESNDLFRADADDLTKEARFHGNIFIYREKIAISFLEEGTDPSYRIIAAKAADRLLTLRGISASFTLVSLGKSINISGRSDGTINVQLILERLHGGGHFDMAGAQTTGMTMEETVTTLHNAIDAYFDNPEKQAKGDTEE